jgi:hypothetical protein
MEIRDNLERYLPAIKAQLSPNDPFGLGLRLSNRAAEELTHPGELEALRELLGRVGLYVFTINGFPYGQFHGAPVKEAVYLPDWLDDERVTYTERLAILLAELLPAEAGLEGSVSTVPGAFKPRVIGADARSNMADRMLRVLPTLHRIRERTGKIVSLALEPEPFCHLATIAETVDFFESALFSRSAVSRAASLMGLAAAEAEAVIRRHLGVCFDGCHMAVEFEPVSEALGALSSAGIRIAKLQISAGLEVSDEAPFGETARALAPFVEDVYLHQVTERTKAGLVRFVDLPEALARGRQEGPWRIHFHVPLFREQIGPFASTQPYLRDLCAALRAKPIDGAHLEVETYTWSVLPEEYRREEITTAIGRELSWVKGELSR